MGVFGRLVKLCASHELHGQLPRATDVDEVEGICEQFHKAVVAGSKALSKPATAWPKVPKVTIQDLQLQVCFNQAMLATHVYGACRGLSTAVEQHS